MSMKIKWDKERQKQYNKEYAIKNRAKILEIKQRYNKRPDKRDFFKNYRLKSKFGISIDEYNQMLFIQQNKCKICNKEETATHRLNNLVQTKQLAVDHCHKTGKIRGLLCANCNRALGYFKDNIDNLNVAKKYLEDNND